MKEIVNKMKNNSMIPYIFGAIFFSLLITTLIGCSDVKTSYVNRIDFCKARGYNHTTPIPVMDAGGQRFFCYNFNSFNVNTSFVYSDSQLWSSK